MGLSTIGKIVKLEIIKRWTNKVGFALHLGFVYISRNKEFLCLYLETCGLILTMKTTYDVLSGRKWNFYFSVLQTQSKT